MKSMTGYGKSQISRNNIDCNIEIKSVNGRYLDVKCYLPREISFWEYELRKTTSKYINRGSIEIKVYINDYREPKLRLNQLKLQKYYDIIRQAQKSLNITSDVSLEYLLNEPGVVESMNSYDEDTDLIALINDCLEEALKIIVYSMELEAKSMKNILMSSFTRIQKALSYIEEKIIPFKEELFSSMHKRINEILNSYNIETTEQRLMQELAIYIDKYDIQEEITRLKSHIQTFLDTINKDAESGKTLNFILQEMQREANTLGSKFSNSKTFSDILTIKEEIEKCREIVQNVS